jgi:hypothetical protein
VHKSTFWVETTGRLIVAGAKTVASPACLVRPRVRRRIGIPRSLEQGQPGFTQPRAEIGSRELAIGQNAKSG